MSRSLQVLIVDDSSDDAILVLRELRGGGFDPEYERVEGAEDLRAALSNARRWDLVLSDHDMPSFGALDMLQIVRSRDPDVPFVIVSGSAGVEDAVQALKAGAQDYVHKDRLSRLVPTVCRELSEAEARRREREAGEALRASEERFRATFEQAAVGMAHVGLSGAWLRVNRRLCEIVGYKEQELLGMSLQDITHPGDLDDDLEQLEALSRGEMETYSMEKRYVRKDGSIVWVRLTVSLFRSGGPRSGETPYFISIIEDISGHKLADKALRLRDRAIVASSNGIVIADATRPDQPITYVNPAFEVITGYEAHEVVGRNCRFLQGEDRDQPGIEEMRDAIREGRYSRVVVRNYKKDGTLFYNEVSVSPVHGDRGRLTAFVGVQNDITDRIGAEEELRRSEDRLSLAVEATELGTWDYDLASREIGCNERLTALLGLRPGATLDYETFLTALHPEHRERVERLIDRALDPGGNGRFDAEYGTFAPDGTERWISARGQAFFEDGRAVRFVGTALEITERRKNEEAQRFLADAGTVLSSSLDYRATLKRLAQLVVPDLADWCAVYMLDEGGALSRLAVAHPDPEKVKLAWRLHEHHPPDPHALQGVLHVIRSGRSEVLAELSEDMLEGADIDDEYREILRRLALRSYMVVPLVARGRTLGAITFVSAESGRRYGPDDLRLAEELARRAAMAVDNARFYEEAQREISERELAEEALRRSEERYRAVVEQTAECLLLFDARTQRILETNTACEGLFGYSAEEFREMKISDMVADAGRGSVDSNVRRVVQSGYHRVGERRYRRKDGSLVDVEVTGSMISYGGHPEVVCGGVRDITERKRTEERLREVREEERRRIAHDLHDEVLSDLVYALQETQIRQELSGGGEGGESLEGIAEALRRSVEGLRAAIFEMRLQEIMEQSFHASLWSLVELSRRMSRGTYEVELEIGEGFPAIFPERQGREVVRILQEAINNARRHSGTGRLKVALGLEDDNLWTEVSDDGRGFDPTLPGGGVGSPVMRQRTARLAGELRVRGAPGRGTRVRFSAPAARILDAVNGEEARTGDVIPKRN